MNLRKSPSQPALCEKDLVELLVSDIDESLLYSCTVTKDGVKVPNPRHDSLSQALIDHAKSRPYRGFFLCTHRYFNHTYNSTLSAQVINVFKTWQGPHYHPRNIFMTSVIQHFSAATALPFIAASTPDDLDPIHPETNPVKQCGYGYTNLTKVYEEKLMSANSQLLEARSLSHYQDVKDSFPLKYRGFFPTITADKNQQLKTIAALACHVFPGKQIKLTFLDNIKFICDEVFNLPQEELPRNVTFEVFHHDPCHDIYMVPLGTHSGLAPLPPSKPRARAASLSKIGLFPELPDPIDFKEIIENQPPITKTL
jgi:hypothetical protein